MMTSLKTCCLLSLSVLLLQSIAPTLSEVVQSMKQCKGFLLENPPEVPNILEKGQIKKPQYKIICQTYKDKRRFVTLYDTKNKIPVLSAYKYRGAGKRIPGEIWQIEPQLEDMKSDKNMKDCDKHADYNNQASDNDYVDAIKHNKGHLFPSSYGYDDNDKTSTFTLTNAVPQHNTFNGGSWANMEKRVKDIMDNYCKNKNNNIEAYLLTGAQPGTEKLNNGVIIPSMLWSAFCCYSHPEKKWLASAFWADNVPDKSDRIYVQIRTLQELYDKLSTGDKRFEAFPGTKHCPLQETVARFYPGRQYQSQLIQKLGMALTKKKEVVEEKEEKEVEKGGGRVVGGREIDSLLYWILNVLYAYFFY